MNDRILEIVVFLMDYMRDNQGRLVESEDFSTTLKTMGYSDNEISSAYFWLWNRFDNSPEWLYADFPKVHLPNRVLTASERVRITTEAYGFLLKLLNLSLIDTEQFETILERVAVFGGDPISVEQVKAIASALVFLEFDEFSSIDSIDLNADHSKLVN